MHYSKLLLLALSASPNLVLSLPIEKRNANILNEKREADPGIFGSKTDAV
jgi:hypothetical protein